MDKAITYRKNFITGVICRLDFSPIYSIKNEDPVQFQNLIRDKFPRSREEYTFTFNNFDKSKDKIEAREEKNWIFADKDKTKKVKLNFSFILIEYSKYKNFTEFKEDFELVFNAFNSIYKPQFYKNMGLRYINEICLNEGSAFQWSGIINKDLLTPLLGFTDNKNELMRYMSVLQYFKEPHSIKFQYGMDNPDFPDRITKRKFVLDYDCRIDDEVEPACVLNYIDQFNADIYSLFEKSINDGLRKIMQEGEE